MVCESGARIPLIARWPGVSKPIRSSAMVSTIDILPTMLDAVRDHRDKLIHNLLAGYRTYATPRSTPASTV